MSFQKPHYPGKPGVHRFFLDANSWQFLILRKARKARALAERVDAEFSQFRASTLEKGFEKASPIARLAFSCDVGQIDQHASLDIQEISDELERLRKIEQAAINLQSRLDDHFGGTYDWKEQAELRSALDTEKG
jgi:hypothetical protein